MVNLKWNLNNVATQNYANVYLLKAYIAVYKFEICISETYLDSSIEYDDGNLEILGYILTQTDYASKSKGGGVCIYYKT